MNALENVIAIDGPAGAGKSTVAKLLAQRLNFKYLDTGAMYRALTYLALKKKMDIKNKKMLGKLASEVDIKFVTVDDGLNHIKINGLDITDKIRSSKVDENVSIVARVKEVRKAMVKIQRKIAKEGKIVMDGRDIGSRVLPDAEIKFFVTASLKERARRRHLELLQRGKNVSYQSVKAKIACRDRLDCQRKISPLIKTKDAILINTTNLSINQTVDKMYSIVKGERNVETRI